MMSLATLEMLLSVNEGQLIEEIIISLLATPQLAVFFEKHPRLKKALLKDLSGWKKDLKQRMQDALVPAQLSEEFELYRQSLGISTDAFFIQLPSVIAKLHQLDSPFYREAHQLQSGKIENRSARQSLFVQKWRVSLILQVTTLHKEMLEQEKEQLLAELQRRLALSGNLEDILGENERAAGQLWDLTKGVNMTSAYNDQLLSRYSEFLRQQPELEKIAQLLGRSQTAQAIPDDSVVLEPMTIMEKVPETVPEQVNGLNQSDDILRLLPAELAMLGLEDIEFEFYRKLLEKQLLTYRLQGDSWQERKVLRPITHHHDEEQPRGPFVVCIDTSGSMGGLNERCAKAFCLALMKIALADNRSCHVMLFSTEIVHYDLISIDGLEQCIRFLHQTFKGGTDLAACLQETAVKLESKQWIDADAVVISDFVAQRLPDELIQKIKAMQKKGKYRFHAVSVSNYGKPSIMKIFDHIWRFDTGLKSRLLRRFSR
ncbi:MULTISPECIES: ATPase RavA stimulator ViaA [Providencia]|uniref:ATPase RavA stimulator ViaA n=1 Tax=Providencia TaxID=586 RepID=UPI002349A749|nr:MULTISPECIES: ATPase RavA stimulator ViaA [unclassified Providencia]